MNGFLRILKRSLYYFKIGILKNVEFKALWASFYLMDVFFIVLIVGIFSHLDTKENAWFYLMYYLVQLTTGFEPWKAIQTQNDIKKGNLLIYLPRPMNYLHFRFFYYLGLDIMRGIFYVIIVMSIAYIYYNVGFFSLLWYMLYTFMAWIIEYFFTMSIVLTAFFIYESEMLTKVVNNIKWFVMGGVVPVTFFPEWFKQISDKLVFSYIGYYKFEVLTNTAILKSTEFWLSYALNLALFVSLTFVLWKKGLKAFESQGG